MLAPTAIVEAHSVEILIPPPTAPIGQTLAANLQAEIALQQVAHKQPGLAPLDGPLGFEGGGFAERLGLVRSFSFQKERGVFCQRVQKLELELLLEAQNIIFRVLRQ